MDLLIRYRDGNDQVSERLISQIEPTGINAATAFCHLRQDNRTFILTRIISAINTETGEIIADLYKTLGVERPPAPPAPPPKINPMPPRNIQEAKRQRNKDRDELYKPFVLQVISDHARSRLFDLFSNVCFNCGSSHELVIDHHYPQSRGGRMVPGNLVVLCRRCNGLKLDRQPASFYRPEQLHDLQPFLDAQDSIFSFKFDWRAWEQDRASYLLSLGIAAELVHAVLTDEDHPLYIQPRDDGTICVIHIDLKLSSK